VEPINEHPKISRAASSSVNLCGSRTHLLDRVNVAQLEPGRAHARGRRRVAVAIAVARREREEAAFDAVLDVDQVSELDK